MSGFPGPRPDPDRKRAQNRFVWLQITRLASLGAVMLGIAIARNAIEGPYVLGVILAVAGTIAFFFGPPLLARRFKARDGERSDRAEP